MNSSEKAFYMSKKFWAMVSGIVSMVISFYFNIPEEMTLSIAGIIISYIFGQSVIDTVSSKFTKVIRIEKPDNNNQPIITNELIKSASDLLPSLFKKINETETEINKENNKGDS